MINGGLCLTKSLLLSSHILGFFEANSMIDKPGKLHIFAIENLTFTMTRPVSS